MKCFQVFVLCVFLYFEGFSQSLKVQGNTCDDGPSFTMEYQTGWLASDLQVAKGEWLLRKYSVSADVNKPSWVTLRFDSLEWSLPLGPGSWQFNLDCRDRTMRWQAADDSAQWRADVAFFYRYFYSSSFAYDAVFSSLSEYGIDAWEDRLFKARKKQLEYMQALRPGKDDADQGLRFMKAISKFTYLSQLYGFPIEQAQRAMVPAVKALPAVMTDGLKGPLPEDDQWISIPAYRKFLVNYVWYQTASEGLFKLSGAPEVWLPFVFPVIQRTGGPQAQSFLTCFFLERYGKVMDPLTLNKFWDALSKQSDGARYRRALEPVLSESLKKKPEPAGKVKPQPKSKDEKAIMVDLNGESVSFDDFKGKVVYVDFWASWCGPCKQQFPFSKSLHDKFSPKQLKNIVFLYISIDDQEDKWKAAIQQFGLEGKHAISKGGWNSPITAKYGIRSIPRYMIIGKDGRIIDEDAKRPSDPAIFDDLIKVLETP
jgi:thiol-disulfide isomerase/thioredoxin